MDLPYWIKLLSNTGPSSKCLEHDTIVFQLVMSIYTHLTPISENLPQPKILSYKNMYTKIMRIL